jgi:hypothetical protein
MVLSLLLLSLLTGIARSAYDVGKVLVWKVSDFFVRRQRAFAEEGVWILMWMF